jgi:hypothetical protein
VWDVECIPRAILIARAISPRHNSRLLVPRVLVGGGYSVQAADVRALVKEDIAYLTKAVTKRQSYLTREVSPHTKRRRLNEMVERRFRVYPSPILEAIEAVTEAIAQVAPGRATNIYDEAARMFSPALWHELLDTIPDDRLTHLLSISFDVLPAFLFLVRLTIASMTEDTPENVRSMIASLPPLVVPLQGRIQLDTLRSITGDETVKACQLMASIYLPLTMGGVIATSLGTTATQPIVDAFTHIVNALGSVPPDMEAFIQTDTVNALFNPVIAQMKVLINTMPPEQRARLIGQEIPS